MGALLSLHRRLVEGPPWRFFERVVFALLAPLGWLYGALGWLRIQLYHMGLLPSYRAPVPVISVGNLAVGGTGKTPVVDHITRYLLTQGRRVAIVSRGYGGSLSQGVHLVSDGNEVLLSPQQAGDEPCLLGRRNPRALILVARKRAEGVRAAVNEHGAEVVLLDDGFQHRAVARDLDIVLLDARRPLGNGWPLPAGVLREFPGALRRGDLFIFTRCVEHRKPELLLPGPVLHSRHLPGRFLLASDGGQVSMESLRGQRGLAFAGIADPGGFFQSLQHLGLEPAKTLGFKDHCRYNADELEQLRTAARDIDYLVTTEKDGVKLQGQIFPIPCYQLPLVLEFSRPGHLEQYLDTLLNVGANHGPITRTS